ncbi:MAG: LysR family transcriptional regulator [Chloroflexi bacterium]|nr:LysR family transcriptional regulator [Chloroflexota bacterium]
MNLSYLKTYLEVVRRGSFSGAARALSISQPAISFHIQRLEEEMGVKLLERRSGRVEMTAAGKDFHRFALKVAAEDEQLRARLVAQQEEVAGYLSLGASTIPGEYIVPLLVAAFQGRYPQVRASIAVADSARVVDMIVNGDGDMGFIGAPMARRPLRMAKLAQDEIVLVTAPGHPLAQRPEVALAELPSQAWVGREEGSGTQWSVEQQLRQRGLGTLHFVLVVGSSQGVVAAVEAGAGIAFVSRLAAEKSLALGRLRQVAVEGLTLRRDIYYIYHQRFTTSRLTREFLAFVERWPSRPGESS